MKPSTLVAALLLAVPLAGCMDALDESRTTEDDDARNERRLVVDVPDGATHIQIDVTAREQAGEADVAILVEDEAGADLAEDTFSVREGTTRQVRVDAAGHDRMVVIVRVLDGEATLDVQVAAVVPGQPIVVVVREEVVIRVEESPPATTTPPTPGTTPPTATTPTPTTTTPPTPPTNATNGTNGTNATG